MINASWKEAEVLLSLKEEVEGCSSEDALQRPFVDIVLEKESHFISV